MQIKLKCPQCSTRLVVNSGNRSPYLRCSICNALFEFHFNAGPHASEAVNANKSIIPSKIPETRSDEATPSPYVADPREQSDTRQPNQSSNEIYPIGFDSTDSSRGKSKLAIVLLILFGLFIVGFVSSNINSKPFAGRTYRIERDFDSYEEYLRLQADELLHSVEVNLNGESPDVWNSKTTAVTVNGRNLTDVERIAILGLPNLKKLAYTNANLLPADIPVLQRETLRNLDLSDSDWKSGSLIFNSSYYPELRVLNLSNTNVNSFALSKIKSCNWLADLDLRGTEIGDSDLNVLNNHPSIAVLDLCNTKVTKVGIMNLQLPELKRLLVSENVFNSAQRQRFERVNPQVHLFVVPAETN